MTRRNRVTPTGAIEPLDLRGAWMGNRGVLHGADGSIHTPWRLTAWLVCRTRFKDRRRTIMAPGRYTELFFLDEAHALAAGHRPCHECRRADAVAFQRAAGHERVGSLDAALHDERLEEGRGPRRQRRKRLHPTRPGDVPMGAMVLVGETCFLRRSAGNGGDDFVAWTRTHEPGRYHALTRGTGPAANDARELRRRVRAGDRLAMLTPPTTARAIRDGYAVALHPSARADVEAAP